MTSTFASSIGKVLGLSDETVKRDWRLAKLWLLREMSGESRDGC
jgi:hypothetical protein